MKKPSRTSFRRLKKLRIATFEVEISPPLGSLLCHGNVQPAREIVTPLLARGIVILGAGDPLVLCSMDWVTLANASHSEVCEAIAKAVGTTSDRVAVHTVHQHDAPGSDLDANILHMPAELFVEYQIAAQGMRPDDFVAMAAYGDNGPGYIGTEVSYSQGGYEARVARVGPAVEKMLLSAIQQLLGSGTGQNL